MKGADSPKRNRMNHEELESMALWTWAQFNPILRNYLYHIPNGGGRSKAEAGRFKAMGVRSGVSDYHLPLARGVYHSLYLELKPKLKGYTPKISKEQKGWRMMMLLQDNAAVIVEGWDEAANILGHYLNLPPGEELGTIRDGQYDRLP